ncbi:MFS transporter [Neisseria animalis]|uniref:MFS transporter n=1 Tax=Neisseria animalis TaxID=492 RepID=A0A5P3MR82_NEIAN|nr:MFS transporter [Neisseria animalis]QEY24084.1 MFS transporter [Neisseria animalis]ROW32652.1 MFS transporter [Neisseria animalis]VEE06241.1 integral membrane transport protein [Neisseria animalis]
MKVSPQVAMTLRQIMLMNFGFFGIQYSFGLQQTAINPIFSFLNADPGQLPILNMAGPITGLLVQPIIGAMSDRTWIPGLGRRRPYFLIGAIGCSLCLFIYPHVTALWVAVLLLWLLDISNNTAMEPFRAFIADKVPEHQQSTGFLMQSVFTGLGITLANFSLYIFQQIGWLQQTSEAGIPYWVFGSFYIGAFCSIASVLVTVFSTPENEPTAEEFAALKAKKEHSAIGEIFIAIKEMPFALWQLALVYLFQWYALFIYWQYISHSIVASVWNATAADKAAYEQAVAWTGLVNGFYNIVTFISAFGLMVMAKKYAAKYVHAFAVALAAAALLSIPHISDKYLMFVPMIGFGIGWASMMGVPFMIVVKAIPKERYGVYMGIVNMMIVIPMLIQTVTFGAIYDTFLKTPAAAMTFGGVFLAIAAVLTLFIRSSNKAPEAPQAG